MDTTIPTGNILPNIDQEFKELIPPLSADELTQLTKNIISSKKCYDAVIVWDGIIIDGHNRFEICMEHGIEFEVAQMHFSSREEAKVWILENQLGRRNLTDAVRIEMVLSLEEMMREKAKKKQGWQKKKQKGLKNDGDLLSKSPKLPPVHVQKGLAKKADVGEGTFHRYTEVRKDGTPEMLEQVKSGKIKIGTAHRLLPKELNKEFNRTDKMLSYIAGQLPLMDEPTRQKMNKRLEELDILRQELIDRLEEKLR